MQINKTGIISLVSGFLGLFLCWNKICIPFILIAFICGIISLTDYLGYKWTAICGMSLALLGATIVFIQIGLPFIKLYKIGEALAEIPSEVVTEKEYVQQTTTTPQTTILTEPTIEPIENVVEEIKPIREDNETSDEIEIVINSVTRTDERTEWEDEFEVVYLLNITIKNNYHGNSVCLNTLYPKAIDSQGQLGDRYSFVDKKDPTIPSGSWDICELGVGLHHEGDFTISFYYYDDLATQHELKYTCKVD